MGGSEQARPRLAIAATGPRGMQLVARYATTWITQDKPTPDASGHEVVQRQLRLLEEACAQQGRDPREIRRLLLAGNGDAQPVRCVGELERCIDRYAALGFHDLVVHAPREQDPHRADRDMLEQIAARF